MKVYLRTINIYSITICPACEGRGRVRVSVPPYPDEIHDCKICRADGSIKAYRLYKGKKL